MNNDGFLPASELNRTQRKLTAAVLRGRGRGQANRNLMTGSNCSSLTLSDVSEENLTRRLAAAVSHMKEDDYFRSFSKVLDEALAESRIFIGKIICYGLGSFGSSMSSRYQLAFLILLKEKLSVEVEIYDPMFTENEIKVMRLDLGYTVMDENEEGNRFVQTIETLFYMPHAPHQLVNNLLYTNWYSTSITKCICICNSFTNLKLNFPKKLLQNNLEYIDRSESILIEYGIINTFPYKDIFNDMALHVFPLHKINELHLSKDYWDRLFEPIYKQYEFLRATTTTDFDSNIKQLKKLEIF